MSSSTVIVAAKQLADRLLDGHAVDVKVKKLLNEYQQDGVQKEKVINHPVQGWTSVHLAAKNGMDDCLEELLKLGGGISRCDKIPMCIEL